MIAPAMGQHLTQASCWSHMKCDIKLVHCRAYKMNSWSMHIDGHWSQKQAFFSHCIWCGRWLLENKVNHFLNFILLSVSMADIDIIRNPQHWFLLHGTQFFCHLALDYQESFVYISFLKMAPRLSLSDQSSVKASNVLGTQAVFEWPKLCKRKQCPRHPGCLWVTKAL